MNTKKVCSALFRMINKACAVLPVFFWMFLIFGFEEPDMAIMTIAAALLHELGHIGYIFLFFKQKPNIRGVLNGMKLRSVSTLSYDEEIGLYLSGISVNLFLFVILSFAASILAVDLWTFAIINLATALSNLLPIEGYDGYGALITMMQKKDNCREIEIALSRLSSALIFIFCIVSLYFIDRQSGGYWIFAVFFVSMIKCIRKGLNEQFTRFNEF